jgi:hypothetical protein
MHQAAKRAGAAPSGAAEDAVPDHDANPDKPEGAGEPDWRRLLDGYAEPGRLRRLRERQQRQRVGAENLVYGVDLRLSPRGVEARDHRQHDV